MKKDFMPIPLNIRNASLDSPISDSNWVYYDSKGNYVGMGGSSASPYHNRDDDDDDDDNDDDDDDDYNDDYRDAGYRKFMEGY